MGNYPIYTYNHLFFTESSKDGNTQNIEFWIVIDNLKNEYPSGSLIIKRVLCYEFGCYYEDIQFESDDNILLKRANEIYQRLYYLTLLKLKPELDTPEINAELQGGLKNKEENSQ